MNREIKFRAWNIPNKLMYQNVQNGLLAKNEKDQLVLGVSLGKLSKDAGSVLMQFTGLHDKNGKEIYEGDFDEEGCVISWCDKKNGWTFNLYDFKLQEFILCHCYNCTGDFDLNDCELKIVGNIYENAEFFNMDLL